MTEIELLKHMPKEHYTTHNGKSIKVGELIELLLKEESDKKKKTKKKK